MTSEQITHWPSVFVVPKPLTVADFDKAVKTVEAEFWYPATIDAWEPGQDGAASAHPCAGNSVAAFQPFGKGSK